MDRFEILNRMEEILNEKVRSIIPGMINCYLIEAPVSKIHREAVDVHIIAHGLIWNDYLGGVARTYRIEQMFLQRNYDCVGEDFIETPELWERFERIVQREIEEMLLKLTKMIKEHIEEEKAWKEQQLANRVIRKEQIVWPHGTD
ncbi:MAG: hypothetical protein J6Y64_06280 [Ruminococcus sp.]|nr:hypothetical protein [Ruminococcus sp.]